MLVGLHVSGQDLDSARARFVLPMPAAVEVYRLPSEISPGSSSGTPTAYGAEFGDVFLGVGYQARTRTGTRADGDVAGGLGLGDPRAFIGIELVYTTFTTLRDGFF